MMKGYFDLDAIWKKVKRYYERGLIQKAYMEEETLFPLRIPLRKITQQAIKKDYSPIIASIRQLERSSLPCEYKTFRFPGIGEQRLPVAVRFDDRDSYLKILGKEHSFERFCADYTAIISAFPTLKELLLRKPLLLEQERGKWERLLTIGRFFLAHPKPRLYIRELPIEGVDTKFLETNKRIIDLLLTQLLNTEDYDTTIGGYQHYGFERKYGLKYPQPQIRFRILDEDYLINGMSDIALPADEFARLALKIRRVFVIENKMTFFSFPPQPHSIAIFGSGYGVGYLEAARWLEHAEIYYWGDLDTHGFAILSEFRSHFPHVKSLLMDEQTAIHYRDLAVTEPENSRFTGELGHLSPAEKECFDALKEGVYGDRYRLEQERIPFDDLLDTLKHLPS